MPEPRAGEMYLGDAVYVYNDPYMGVVLYTSNGLRETNRIVLEARVLLGFLEWIERQREEAKRG